ncbi:hypothetical protein CEXT_693751 [Caerostris extrusa]|uniref:Uncharacterized protein n=1 Tax=Caerostris extrusa TaxID=172846 RepID=A0AAV4Y143_CAEEX|nr:hypothetical protein CEXT_693751 [Caerostris extrusa]
MPLPRKGEKISIWRQSWLRNPHQHTFRQPASASMAKLTRNCAKLYCGCATLDRKGLKFLRQKPWRRRLNAKMKRFLSFNFYCAFSKRGLRGEKKVTFHKDP